MPERQPMTTRLKTLFQQPALFVLDLGRGDGIAPLAPVARRRMPRSKPPAAPITPNIFHEFLSDC
jgi:hypothetical protein